MTYRTLFSTILENTNKEIEQDKGQLSKKTKLILTSEYVETYYSRKKNGQVRVDNNLEKHAPIAIVKFAGNKKSHCFGPYALFSQLMENPRDIIFIQLFVYSRGKQIESHIICELLFSFDNSSPIARVSKVLV